MYNIVESALKCTSAPMHETLESFIGDLLCTVHTKERRWYRITGITSKPVENLKIHIWDMKKFFLDRHKIVLKRPDLPAYICEDGAVIPVELCFRGRDETD